MRPSQKRLREEEEPTPVLIVGGSLVGLSTALFLAFHGIPCVLVERHDAQPSFHPRAVGFNQRTLEIFRTIGVEAAIRQAEPPAYRGSGLLRVETLTGKRLGWLAQGEEMSDEQISPVRASFIPQNMLEPVLLARAREMGADLRFTTELISFEQEAEGVRAVVRERVTGQEQSILARFLIAADGSHSPIRQALGIATQGPGEIGKVLSIAFRADLRNMLGGERVIFYIIDKVRGILRVDPSGKQGILNVYQLAMQREGADPSAEELVYAALGTSSLAVEILGVLTWDLGAWVAEHYQQDRVFLVGDAAHIMPPTSGLGANTGIAEAHNLAWKLALVLKGAASSALLTTYEHERRPVAQATMSYAFAGIREMFTQQPADQRAAQREALVRMVFGYRYIGAAVFSDAESAPKTQEFSENPSVPTGHLGSRAPHVPLERDGKPCSTLDLFGRHFVLLTSTGASGDTWRQAAQRVVQHLDLDLNVHRIGDQGQGECFDVEGRFFATYGLTETGAVLVRPDGFIGWRVRETSSSAEQCEQMLAQVLAHVLCRDGERGTA